jgi:hypothetical protein
MNGYGRFFNCFGRFSMMAGAISSVIRNCAPPAHAPARGFGDQATQLSRLMLDLAGYRVEAGPVIKDGV